VTSSWFFLSTLYSINFISRYL